MARHPRRAGRCRCRGDAGEVGREVWKEGDGASSNEGGGKGREAAEGGCSQGGRKAEEEDCRQEESRARHGETGVEDEEDPGPMKRVFRDIQFWIPVLVLVGGLLVLQWIR